MSAEEGTLPKSALPDLVLPKQTNSTIDEYVQVVFDLPQLGILTYRQNANFTAGKGCRVLANLGKREVTAFVIGTSKVPDIDSSKIKPLTKIVDEEPIFNAHCIELARWMSSMYYCSFGQALAAMLPSATSPTRMSSTSAEEISECTEDSYRGGGVEGMDYQLGDRVTNLSEEQVQALDRINNSTQKLHYLYGLTGSGKTEVFLQAAEKRLNAGESVIYLVPEIALTGQVVEAAKKRFGSGCAILHSKISGAKKLLEWKRIIRGEARMIIGARSAIFAPTQKLGLVVIDEEPEGSYKSHCTPRYHARQVAMKRCAIEGASLVMGSATPSVEAKYFMEKGTFAPLSLTKRLAGGSVPTIEVVDMKQEEHPLSKRLLESMRTTRAEGRQSILFLNRRGFAYSFRCQSCNKGLECVHCSVSLTYHKTIHSLVCHYCGYKSGLPSHCPSCGSLDVVCVGFGTERIESEVYTQFPDARIARLDTDTCSRKGELESILKNFKEGRVEILLGTQMIAKGLNFPGLKTVGIVLADTSLNVPDFRSAERTFSLILQVAGRTGRFFPDGQVILQTYRPDSPIIKAASLMDSDAFYKAELDFRKKCDFPPFTRLIRVVFKSKEARIAKDAAQTFASQSRQYLAKPDELLGPAECPLGRIKTFTRWHILYRSAQFSQLHKAVLQTLQQFRSSRELRLEIDTDPTSIL